MGLLLAPSLCSGRGDPPTRLVESAHTQCHRPTRPTPLNPHRSCFQLSSLLRCCRLCAHNALLAPALYRWMSQPRVQKSFFQVSQKTRMKASTVFTNCSLSGTHASKAAVILMWLPASMLQQNNCTVLMMMMMALLTTIGMVSPKSSVLVTSRLNWIPNSKIFPHIGTEKATTSCLETQSIRVEPTVQAASGLLARTWVQTIKPCSCTHLMVSLKTTVTDIPRLRVIRARHLASNGMPSICGLSPKHPRAFGIPPRALRS